ncbi:MAG: hypothetical protein IJA97_00510 [Clostridia bacterium]|nr:hypothetical protein [Clostridia bacterium]
MVNKLTKRKLKLFVSYDLWKVIIVSALACLVFLLAFNFVARKPTDGQDFKILIDKNAIMGEDVDGFFENLFTKSATEGGFSYEMLKGETVMINGTDENPDEYLIRSVYGDLHYDDVVILQEPLYEYYFKTCYMAADISEYINSAIEFVSINACDESGEINEQKVYDYFDRTRKGDSRFRTKAEKEQGRKDELDRFKGILLMATELRACFIANPELLDKEREYTYYGGEAKKGVFGLRLGALVGRSDRDISKLFGLKKYKEGTNEIYYSADGLYLAIGNNVQENGDLYYEMLAVMYTLIDTYTTLLD